MNLEQDINNALREFNSGNKETAYKKLIQIFNKNKSNDQLRFNIAVIEQALNLNEKAKYNYEYLVKKNSNFKAIINLYILNLKQENFKESLSLINLLIKKSIISEQIIRDKAFVLFKLKQYDLSIDICKDYLKKNNDDVNFLNILGLNYFEKKEVKKSENIYKKALLIDSNNVGVLNSLGRLFHESRNSKNAEKYFLKAYELNNASYEIINNLAGFYREEGQYDKALKFYEKAININPNNPSIINNLAKTFFDLNNIGKAEEYSLKALKINPEDGNIQKILSLIYLHKHDYIKGWKYFDGRLNLSDFVKRNSLMHHIKKKLYTKNKIKDDSRILVLREQGVGDEILYGTMYKDVLQNWKNVTIECDLRLKKLFFNSFYKYSKKFVELGAISENKQNIDKYDHVIYAGSLGKYFRKDANSFSADPYLIPDKNLILKFKKKFEKYKGKYKIGISWKSFKNRYAEEKSLELDHFKSLFKNSNLRFICLQYGNVKNEIQSFNKKIDNELIELEKLDIYNDFDGLSAVLKNLDLFITVSNSTAHLAGALGVKTFLIKPTNHAVFHYWDQPNNKTPWYSSITLFKRNEFLEMKGKVFEELG